MESPFAQRMDKLWRSLLMIVASSSALFRSPLPPNGSSIEADWSRRKMKHPGFLRLISALYMLAPFLRLLAFFDLLGRHVDLVATPVLHQDPVALLLDDGDFIPTAKRHGLPLGGALLHLRGELLRLDERGKRRQRTIAEDQRCRPAGQAQRDERDPEMEQLECSTDPRASARRARRPGSPIWKPGQTACSAPHEALGHGNGPRKRLVRLLAPSTARPAHIGVSFGDGAAAQVCRNGRRDRPCGQVERMLAEKPTA